MFRKIKIWFAGNRNTYSDYLLSKIKTSENFELTEIFNSQKELFQALNEKEPDMLILDLEVDKNKLLKSLTEISQLDKKMKIVLVLEEEDEEFILPAVCKGVYDYFVKDNKIINIESKLMEVYKSKTPLSSILSNNVRRTFEKVYLNELNYDLSPREKEILNLMIGGFTKKKMAEMLSISFHTIDSHLRKIYRKLGVKTKTEAVSKALKEQLVLT